MKNKILALGLILLGLLVVLFPKINEKYEDYRQAQIVAQWEDTILDLSNEDEILEDEISPEELEKSRERREGDMEGILKIDRIDLKLPILTGASHENMKTAVASIENTGQLGEVGNYSIAGHRNLTYGRNFNRLDELKEGDLLEVETKDRLYKYRVEEKLYVTPEDTWVLNSGEDKEMTLVTCHPVGVATHRLIIKGKLLEGD